MVLADEPIRSEEAMNGPVPNELPFLQVQRFLAKGGVRVPAIHLVDEAAGHLWLDDLGDVVLKERLEVVADVDGDRVATYRPAVELLVDFQRATAERRDDIISYHRAFEAPLLRWELDHYREWRIEAQLGARVSASQLNALADAFDGLVARLTALPQVLCHRDFQSTNLMVTRPEADDGGLVLIDFQDALLGPYAYDLVSLLRDSYIALDMAEVDALVDHYLSLRGDLEPAAFRTAFHLQTVQRKLKDSGRFVYIDRVKNNPHYLQFIDDSLGYVREALERLPELATLRGLLAGLDPTAFA